MNSFKIWLAIGAVIAMAVVPGDSLWAQSRASQGFLRTVAISGTLAPGTTTTFDSFGVLLNTSSYVPSMNADGHVAFQANAGGLEGIWTEAGGAGLSLAAQRGRQVPGMPNGVVFNHVLLPRISDSGTTGFHTSMIGPGVSDTDDEMLWVVDHGGAPEIVYREGTAAAGVESDVTFGVGSGGFLLNATGDEAFSAALRGPSISTLNEQGLWAYRNGNQELIVRGGQQAPGMAVGTNFLSTVNSSMNARAEMAFSATLTGGDTTSANDRSIWRETETGDLQIVMRSGDPAPNMQAGFAFAGGVAPTLVGFNSAGQVAYTASLLGPGVNTDNDRGVWIKDPDGPAHLVAREGAQAPGLPLGAVYGNFQSVKMNSVGETALHALVEGLGVIDPNDEAVFALSGGESRVIMRRGDTAPGAPTGATISDISRSSLNAQGQVIIQGSIALVGGGHVQRAIWMEDLSHHLRLVIAEGDQLEVTAGDVRTVARLNLFLAAGGGDDGQIRSFNDRGEVSFIANFTDGSSGVFVSSVPEPRSLELMAIAIFGGYMFVRLRRRR